MHSPSIVLKYKLGKGQLKSSRSNFHLHRRPNKLSAMSKWYSCPKGTLHKASLLLNWGSWGSGCLYTSGMCFHRSYSWCNKGCYFHKYRNVLHHDNIHLGKLYMQKLICWRYCTGGRMCILHIRWRRQCMVCRSCWLHRRSNQIGSGSFLHWPW